MCIYCNIYTIKKFNLNEYIRGSIVLDCPDLAVIPILENIISLTLVKSRTLLIPLLENLEELNNLKVLYLKGCLNLKKLPKLHQLEKLTLSSNTTILEIPKLNNLISLKLLTCNISKIPFLKNLKKLHLYKCILFNNLYILKENKSLKDIFNFSSINKNQMSPISIYLEKLEIDHCNNITKIPHMSNLKELYINDCNNITKIPHLSNLKELYINDCNNIDLLYNIY